MPQGDSRWPLAARDFRVRPGRSVASTPAAGAPRARVWLRWVGAGMIGTATAEWRGLGGSGLAVGRSLLRHCGTPQRNTPSAVQPPQSVRQRICHDDPPLPSGNERGFVGFPLRGPSSHGAAGDGAPPTRPTPIKRSLVPKSASRPRRPAPGGESLADRVLEHPGNGIRRAMGDRRQGWAGGSSGGFLVRRSTAPCRQAQLSPP